MIRRVSSSTISVPSYGSINNQISSRGQETTMESDPVPISSRKTGKEMLTTVWTTIKSLRMEPLIFLFSLTIELLSVTLKTYYLQVICVDMFRDNSTMLRSCYKLEFNDSSIEDKIQKVGSEFEVYRNIVEFGIPSLCCLLFIGEITDRFGSRFMLLLGLGGHVVSSLYRFFLYHFVYINQTPWLVLSSSIPLALTGGDMALQVAGYTYMTKVVTSGEEGAKSRGFRFAIMDACSFVGTIVGLQGGAQVLSGFGYGYFWIFLGTTQALCFAFTWFFLENDATEERTEAGTSIFKQMWVTVQGTVRTCIKKREGSGRSLLILLYVIGAIQLAIGVGVSGVLFLYTRKRFGWNNQDYTNFSTFDTVAILCGILFTSIVLLKTLKLHEPIVMGIGFLSVISSHLIIAIASSSGWMFLASSLSSCFKIVSTLVRSLSTRLVDVDEAGKVNSFLTMETAIVSFTAVPIFNLIYVSTVDTDPGRVFFTSAGVGGFGFILVCILWFAFKKSTLYSSRSGAEMAVVDSTDNSDHTSSTLEIDQPTNTMLKENLNGNN